MPDISMCSNDECPLVKKCYRHEAEPTPMMQAYSEFTPDDDGECEYFMEIWKRKEIG